MRVIVFATAALLAASSAVAQYDGRYGCTEDCSGHDAGYEWAEENAITDPDDCGGNSQSFIEGCMTYAEDQQAEIEDESGLVEACDAGDEDACDALGY